MTDETKPQTTREIMDKLYAMTPEEVNRFLGEHFQRIISKPLPDDAVSTSGKPTVSSPAGRMMPTH
jgi:hypothetical protein